MVAATFNFPKHFSLSLSVQPVVLPARWFVPGGLFHLGYSEAEEGQPVLPVVCVQRTGHPAARTGSGPLSRLPVRGPHRQTQPRGLPPLPRSQPSWRKVRALVVVLPDEHPSVQYALLLVNANLPSNYSPGECGLWGWFSLFGSSRPRWSFICSGFVCDLMPHTLYGNFTQTRKFSRYLLALMLLESQMNFHCATKHLWSVAAKQLCSILLNLPK